MVSRNAKYRARLRSRARRLLKWDAGCRLCGSIMAPLEFAHIFPTRLSGPGRGMDRRYRDIIQNPLCYAVMCRPCHHKYDHTDEPF